ncbi:unnamed protein product, partial [Amoebophrya sp. A25]|eukprot:GSA25T00016404001.1
MFAGLFGARAVEEDRFHKLQNLCRKIGNSIVHLERIHKIPSGGNLHLVRTNSLEDGATSGGSGSPTSTISSIGGTSTPSVIGGGGSTGRGASSTPGSGGGS